VQLDTVRFLGTFLARPTEAPEIVARRVAAELAAEDPDRLAAYGRREPTHREHAGAIQREYGYRDFSDASAQAELPPAIMWICLTVGRRWYRTRGADRVAQLGDLGAVP
jgi:Domain of unknown function (DUF4158)